jgi:hypothetical protein
VQSTKLFDLVRDLAEQLPSLLTSLACIIFVIFRWRRNPRTSSLLLVALVLLCFHTIVFSIIYTWVPDLFINAALIENQETVVRTVHTILGLIANSSFAVIIALILAAIFSQRPATASY